MNFNLLILDSALLYSGFISNGWTFYTTINTANFTIIIKIIK